MWIRWISDRFVSLMNRVAPLWGRPRVRTVTTVELARWLNHEPESVVLVDVRSDKEVLVSQIPGAITRREFNECRHDCRDKLVIAYCTVGGRSLLFAQECAKMGLDVRNYQGSILAWCDAGGTLVAPDGAPTHRVHTLSRMFHVPDGYQQVY